MRKKKTRDSTRNGLTCKVIVFFIVCIIRDKDGNNVWLRGFICLWGKKNEESKLNIKARKGNWVDTPVATHLTYLACGSVD
jgi:hypothetical protein